MSKSVWGLSAGLVLVAGYAGYLQVENERLKEALLAVGTGTVGVPDLGVETAPVEVEVGEVAAPEGRMDGAPSGPVAVEPERRERGQDWRRERMQRMAAAFEDPEMRLDMVERQMGRIDASYAGFFGTLNLDAGQIDLLKTLMAEQGVVGWESRMRRFAAGSDEARAELEASERQQREALDGQIAALLGTDGAAALQDYTESLPHREEVAALATRLSYTDSPLSAAQSELLVQGLQSVAAEFRYTKDLSEMPRGGGRLEAAEVELYFSEREQRDALVFEAAAGALNEEQLAAFADRQIAERERERRRMEFALENGGFGRGGPQGGGFGGGRP